MSKKGEIWPTLKLLIGIALGAIVIYLAIMLGKWLIDSPIM